MVSQVKLIAEPWDIGEGGYQVGNFPGLWTEWNGKYRDTVRDYWRGEPATLGEFASRLTGSSDLYEATGRRPSASINFVTCHDGFTLTTWCPTTRSTTRPTARTTGTARATTGRGTAASKAPPTIRTSSRCGRKQMRNIIGTLMLSQGTPMLSHGDEIGRTQKGNNNVYCQDSETRGWTGRCARPTPTSSTFTRKVTELRKNHPVFRRRRFFEGKPIRTGDQVRDIAWLTPAGTEMTPEDWGSGFKCVAVFLNGEAIPAPNERGERVVDDSFLLCFNAHDKEVDFVAPDWRLRQAVDRRTRHRRPDRCTRTSWLPRAKRSRCSRGHFSCCVRPPDAWLLGAVDVSAADARRLLHLRRRRRPGALPRRPRRVAPVPVPDPDRGRGLDARVRRHRSHHGVSGARRRRRAGAAVDGGAERAAWA